MTAAIYTVYILNCFFLIMVVLLQAGRGGGLSFAGGASGGSATVFGAGGATTFLQKLTIGSAVGFMSLSMLLAYISSSPGSADTGTFIDPELGSVPGDTSAPDPE